MASLDSVYHIDGIPVTLKELLKTWREANHGPWYIQKQREEHPGLSVVDNLEVQLGEAWDRATERIANGEAPHIALSDYQIQATRLLEDAYRDAFLAGLEDEEDDDEGLIFALLGGAISFLGRLVLNLGEQTSKMTPEQAADLMRRRRSRAVSYAGGAWQLYVRALIHRAEPDEIWEWFGPIDGRTCTPCFEEVLAGPRLLSEITRYPVRDTDCMSRCRHLLRRRRDLEEN